MIKDNTLEAEKRSESNNIIYRSSFIIQIIVITIAALFLFAMGIFMAIWLRKRINTVMNFANNLSEGDLTQEMKITSEDELGNMGIALNKASANIRELVAERLNQIRLLQKLWREH